MKRISLLLALAASVAAAQTSSTPAKPAGAATAKTGTAGTAVHPAAAGPKLPPGVPPGRGLMKTAFALRYQDLKLGTGAVAEPMKLYKVNYTGWLAADGKKFDSSFDHKRPVMDKDGKPEVDADGKPKLGEAEPIEFPQGRRAVIPGWDQGFEGMKIGGKRRLFIPYQLAYGANGRPPVIPAKADLIFDVELVDQRDVPAQQMPPGAGRQMEMRQHAPGAGASPSGATPPPANPNANPNANPGANPATTPGATTPPPAQPSGQPADPTAPTQAPNSAAPPPPPPPDKPSNPNQ